MTIDQFNFAGKKAFVRVDFNVPLDENFNITDDNRMRAALPTLKKILADGGSIIIGSHLGRPKGPADKFSLKHILNHLSELLGVDVQFANDCMGEEAAVKAAANETIFYTEDPIVSSDVIGQTCGTLFDAQCTKIMEVDGKQLVKVITWYDNEMSYTAQMVRTAKYLVEHFK